MPHDRSDWDIDQWHQYYCRKIDQLRKAQRIQEKIHDSDKSLLTRVNRDYENSLVKIRQQNIELLKAKQEIESAYDYKSQFLATITHEIRTPLNSILGMLDLLSETSLGPEQSRYLTATRRSSEILLNLINNVLGYSRIEAGLDSVRSAPTDVSGAVKMVVESLQQQADLKGLSLSYRIEASLPEEVLTDRGKLVQILVNLVGNGIKYTEAGGVRVRVTRDLNRNVIHFSVADTGCGIAPKDQGTIFEQYGRASDNSRNRAASIGLGLFISKNLVELLGGALQVSSTLGSGSDFYFDIPFVKCEPSDNGGEDGSEDERIRGVDLSILVVDDDESNRMLFESYLNDIHEVHFANDGLAACEMSKDRRYDVILMDMNMPVMDGFNAVRCIRGMRRPGHEEVIVAVTACDDPDIMKRCREVGCDSILVKPISKKQLHREIAKCAAMINGSGDTPAN